MNKLPNGKTLPFLGRNYILLDALLTRTYVRKVVKLPDGKSVLTPPILIRTVRQNIKRCWHLIDEGICPSQHEFCRTAAGRPIE